MAVRPKRRRQQVAEALRAAGYSVWRDDELPAHRAYSESSRSGCGRPRRWSCCGRPRRRARNGCGPRPTSRARRARWCRSRSTASCRRCPSTRSSARTSAAGAATPSAPGWRKVESSVACWSARRRRRRAGRAQGRAGAPRRDLRAAVHQHERRRRAGIFQRRHHRRHHHRSVEGLGAVGDARNTAFTLKGQTLEAGQIARQLNVTHVLEGSIRKAGDRVRINAQLIDARSRRPVWAERYDRDLTDIFAIQDEISKAIVARAAGSSCCPRKRRRSSTAARRSVEAYNLYLMARQHWISGNDGDIRRDEVVVRIAARRPKSIRITPRPGR